MPTASFSQAPGCRREGSNACQSPAELGNRDPRIFPPLPPQLAQASMLVVREILNPLPQFFVGERFDRSARSRQTTEPCEQSRPRQVLQGILLPKFPYVWGVHTTYPRGVVGSVELSHTVLEQ